MMKAQAVHDRGGWPEAGPIDPTAHPLEDWELRTHAVRKALERAGLLRVDELRRAWESLSPAQYEQLAYYEKWAYALESLLVEKHVLTTAEIDARVAALQAQDQRE